MPRTAESAYCAFGLEYCRKCYPTGGGLQYLRLDSGQAQTTKKADVLALLDRNGGFPLPSGEPNLMVSTVRENFENRAYEAVHFKCYHQWWQRWKWDKAARKKGTMNRYSRPTRNCLRVRLSAAGVKYCPLRSPAVLRLCFP